MKSIILARVSTEEQKEAGNSLPAQITRLKKYCESKNFEVIQTFSFDESAYKSKRDEFDKVIEYLEKNKEKIVLCFDKVDRLSRNIFDKRVSILYEKAINGEIELHFVSDNQVIDENLNAVSKFQFGMNLNLSQYYSNAISDNVKRSFEKMRAEGKWLGVPRIGYINTTNSKGEKVIEVDEGRAFLIRKLFELYSTGNFSISSLHSEISQLGLRSRSGEILKRSNIEVILKDTFYYGIAYSKKNNLLYPHIYPRLISEDLFLKCKEIREGRSVKISKLSNTNFIFKGLLTCKNCGCLITPEEKTKKNGRKYIYYSCTNSKGICKRQYVSENVLLDSVNTTFERFSLITEEIQFFILDELRKNIEIEVDYHKKQLARIKSDYNEVQGKIKRITDLLIDNSITKEDYEARLHEYKIIQCSLNYEIEQHTKADKDYLLTVSTVISLARRVREIFDSSEIQEKRALLNFILQNPTLDGKNLCFTLASPFDLLLEIDECPIWLPRVDSNHEPLS